MSALGHLSGEHLGSIIRFADGGATYEGVLQQVHHSEQAIRRYPVTLVHLTMGEWRHIKTYPSDTDCEVLCGWASDDGSLCRLRAGHYSEPHGAVD